MTDTITLDELVAEYQRLGLTKDDEGLTSRELSDRWGIGHAAVLKRLHMAAKAEILRSGRKTVKRIDGQTTGVACYWFDVPKRKKK